MTRTVDAPGPDSMEVNLPGYEFRINAIITIFVIPKKRKAVRGKKMVRPPLSDLDSFLQTNTHNNRPVSHPDWIDVWVAGHVNQPPPTHDSHNPKASI